MPWDAETAKAMAAKGGKASGEAKRLAKLTAEDRAKEALKGKSEKLVKELLKAALGEDEYELLSPKDRLAAVTRALEYAIGRPYTSKPETKPEESDEDTSKSPLGFSTRQETAGE